jgi:sec-independent protein translocase protein TatA
MLTGFLTPTHVVMLLGVVLLLCGTKRLPEVGKSLGDGLRGFKQGLDGRDEPERLE